MNALTLTEPWATLMMLGEKHIETRSWRPPAAAIGKELAIHAAKGFPLWAQDLCEDEPFRSSLLATPAHCDPRANLGRILCIVKLLGYRLTEDVRGQIGEKEVAFGDYSDGRVAWFTEFVRPIERSTVVKGRLGIWNWTPPA